MKKPRSGPNPRFSTRLLACVQQFRPVLASMFLGRAKSASSQADMMVSTFCSTVSVSGLGFYAAPIWEDTMRGPTAGAARITKVMVP